MTLDCKLHRKMKQSRVISCAWPHRPIRTVAFIISLLPCPTRFVSWLVERAYFVRGRTGQFARWPFYICFCLSLPGIVTRQKERFLFCCGAQANNLPISRNIYSAFIANRVNMDYTMSILRKERDPSWKKTD